MSFVYKYMSTKTFTWTVFDVDNQATIGVCDDYNEATALCDKTNEKANEIRNAVVIPSIEL